MVDDIYEGLAGKEPPILWMIDKNGRCLSKTEDNIYSCNLYTGESKKVFTKRDDWDTGEEGLNWSAEYLGDSIIITYDDYSEPQYDPYSTEYPTYKRFLLNEETGELTPLTISSQLGSISTPIEIEAGTDDSILVISDRWKEDVQNIVNGTLITETTTVFRYSMLSKEDFFSNTLNYREITEVS